MKPLKLSLHILFEELQKCFAADADIGEDVCCICDVRACDPAAEPELLPEYVYLFPMPDTPEHSRILHKNGTIHVHASFPQTINEVLSIFRRYQGYEEELRLALMAENPFQAIAETANRILNFPFCISNNIFRTIGLAGDGASQQIQYLDLNRQTSPAYLDFILKPQRFTKYMSGRTAWRMELPPDCMCESILRVNCFYENVVRCRIVLMPPAAFHSTALTQLMEYIGHVVEEIPLSIAEGFFSDSLSSDSGVSESGQPSEGTALLDAIRQYILDKPFYVCRITSAQSNSHNFGAIWVRKKLENMNIPSPIYLFNNDVILLLTCGEERPDVFFKQLSHVLKEIRFACYVSNLCQQVSDISECIRQTWRLAEIFAAAAGEYVYYEDHAIDCLMKEIAAQQNWGPWLYQGFPLLEKRDADEHSSYHQTLSTLADKHFIHQDAAAELFLHRNSFKYRINKIEEFLDCDLSDSELQFFVRLSYLLLRGK